ncbi:hypothetical protein D9615_007730 [Tricholomella constricta]|uniref:Small secreted protein n=1 Tax=Tricholomella constricta TaxID=117010 RepID=A0A8H5M0F7_9AGAR|nr:hypothetical protein D9615_007730 [Tricholomella constricta]
MVQITSIVLFFSSLASFVSAAPVPHKSSAVAPAAATLVAASTGNAAAAVVDGFQLLNYADFQISGGVAGNAAAEANAIFVDPFDDVDLAILDDQIAKDMETMRKAAEAAETGDFNPAIAAASGAEATALQVGKIKNKVLKLTAFCQVLNIKIAKAKAAGKDSADLEAKLASQQTKLNSNIATDQKSAGAVSQAIV